MQSKEIRELVERLGLAASYFAGTPIASSPEGERCLISIRQAATQLLAAEEAFKVEEEEAVRFRDERNVMRDALETIRQRSTKPWRFGEHWHRQQWAADLVDAALSHPADPKAALAALHDAASLHPTGGEHSG